MCEIIFCKNKNILHQQNKEIVNFFLCNLHLYFETKWLTYTKWQVKCHTAILKLQTFNHVHRQQFNSAEAVELQKKMCKRDIQVP